GFLFRFVNDPGVADDLVQETLLQVHLAANSFDLNRPFKPWLYTIAANKARDLLRSRARRQERSLNAPGGGDDAGPTLLDSLESAEQPTAERIEETEQQRQVRDMIALMPENLRLILVLGYYQQLPYAEISQILDIPVGTVKSRLHSAVGHFGKLWRGRVNSARAPNA
ncbi:MAG: RNA polymerase sigma factor, partial [Planctomycetes bacterium]|nr:RNA polymerase sigma factor [Planctomycetota bacterium]